MDWSYDQGYCHFRVVLYEHTKQAPLNNVIERVGVVSLLLSGTLLANWRNVIDELTDLFVDENTC
jgi:hypothetical protein